MSENEVIQRKTGESTNYEKVANGQVGDSLLINEEGAKYWAPGKMALGSTPGNITNGGKGPNILNSFQVPHLPVTYTYDSSGSLRPKYYDFAAEATNSVSPDDGTDLTDPQNFAFSALASDIFIKSLNVKPVEAGNLRVKIFTGADNTGNLMVDQTFIILSGDIGNSTNLLLANPQLYLTGNLFYMELSGIRLQGASQSSGEFMSQLKPFLEFNQHDLTEKAVASTDDIPVKFCTLSDLKPYLNMAETIYELPEGRYEFCGPIDYGTRTIDLITLNGNYTFYNENFFQNTQTYSGTTPFITNSVTTGIFNVIRVIYTTPNAKTFGLVNGGSLILEFPGFIGCKQSFTLDDFLFLTVPIIAQVGCELGAVVNNVGTSNILIAQWSDGQDLGGTGFTFKGTGDRIFITVPDSRPKASECFVDIQSSYTGDVEIGLGSHTKGGGDFFKAGSRNQADPNINVTAVKNVPDSKFIGNVVVNGNATETVIVDPNVWVDVNFGANAVEASNIERWSLEDTTNGRLKYTGNEDYNFKIDGHFSVLSPGSQNYELRYVIDRGAGFVVLADDIMVPFATDSARGTFPVNIPLEAITDEEIKPQVRNIDGTDNITITHLSAGPANQ